ncbi:MAG: type IX secretion system membrane protein PorP/SprF [Bacteroidetes bacterium]|nr:type IX secretion system membrane protein PorP/SprF [Bacteroidota bacterium]
MKKLLLSILLVGGAGSAMAQDLEFTQFYSNPIYLNPALAGTHGCPRFALNYRNQWPSLSSSYVSYAAAYDQFFDNISGGFGVILVNDVQAKVLNTTTGSLVYSYHLRLGRKWTALFGAKATWAQKYLDWDKLTFGDQIDPRRGFIYQTGDVQRGGSKGFFDASAGTVVYNKNFNIGFAANHLNTPNESVIVGESKLPMRFTGHASANIPLGGRSKYKNQTTIMPSVLYSYQQGFQQLNIGSYIKYGNFTTGAYFRNRDAFILTLGLATDRFRLGYSYDVTVSKLNNGVSGGSHEVSLAILVACRKKPASFRTIDCPTF